MSSYIRSIAGDIRNFVSYGRASVVLAFLSVQRFIAGQELVRLENAEITLRSTIRRLEKHNQLLAGQNVNLRRALDARNVRAGTDALIAGRTRFGDIVSDTALTYDEVYLPSHKTSILVGEDSFIIRAAGGEDDTLYDVTGFDQQADGSFKALLFEPAPSAN